MKKLLGNAILFATAIPAQQAYAELWLYSSSPAQRLSFATSLPGVPAPSSLSTTHQLTLGPGTYGISLRVSAEGSGVPPGASGAQASMTFSLDAGGAQIMWNQPPNPVGAVDLVNGANVQQFTCSQPPSGIPDVSASWAYAGGVMAARGSIAAQATPNGASVSLSARYAANNPSQWPYSGGLTYGEVGYSVSLTVSQTTIVVVTVSMDCATNGQSQSVPTLPTTQTPSGGGAFLGGPTGNWFDPPLALGYDFQQTGGSLFTDILTLPVGIDGDGLFEVQVGNQSLGQFAEGTGVNFVQLLGNGVPAFRIVGIDPGADATDVEAFPVQLAFNTPTADFTMTPVLWRAVGSSCSDAVCAQCPATTLAPIGDALEGNLNFGLGITNGPANGAAGFYVGLGSASPFPIPLFCGSVLLPLQTAFFDVGATLLPGSGTCDGAGSILLPLVPTPPLFGLFLTVQAITLCPQGGLGLTHAIEFPIGS